MTTPVNLFADDPSTPPQPDPNVNYLETLVGDGKKFKSVEDLAKGKAEADAFIERLTREQEQLRQELSTKLTMEQYIDKMAAPSPNTQTPNEPNGNQGENFQGLKPEDVERIIDQRVSAREAERIQTENLRTVKETLTQSLGPDFPNKLKSISQAIGMSEEDMTDMAKLRPKAFLALVQAQAPQQQTQQGLFTPPGSQQPQGFKPSSSDRTHSYYENLRKTNPTEYWTPRVQNQMHQEALRLGEKFFDS